MISRICFIVAGLLGLASLGAVTHAQMPGTFTPLLVSGAPSCVPFDSNTMAIWHFDNNLLDSSQRGHNGTFAGAGGSLSATQSKFGGYSYQQTAYTGAVNLTNSADFSFGMGDLTWEGWGYLTSNPTYWGLWGQQTSLGWYSASNTVTIYVGSYGQFPWTPPVNQWVHIALVRKSLDFFMYANGIQVGSVTTLHAYSAGDATTNPVQIGNYGGTNGSYWWPGFLDEVRISNVARYTGTFMPPTVPFCNPISPYTGPGDLVSGASAWWGMRAYNRAAAATNKPIINVRRSSDNATCDMGADFNLGTPNVAANCSTGTNNGLSYTGFCTSQCYTTKSYDQSGANQCGGAACDVLQATAANQPAANTSGAMGNLGGFTYSTSTQTLNSASGPTLAQPFTVHGVAQRTGTFTTQGTFYLQATNPTQFLFANTANTVGLLNGGTIQTATAADSTSHSLSAVFNGASSSITVDANAAVTVNTPTTAAAGIFSIGPGASGNPLTGTISEMGVWPRQLTATEITALCNNEFGAAYSTACGVIPPCTPNTQGGGTFANVMGLWHFDNNLNDSSGRGHTGTLIGTGGNALSSAQSKFGGFSYFNGTTVYNGVLIPYSTDFAMRTGDWTFEAWSYATTPSQATTAWWGGTNTSYGGDWFIGSTSAANIAMYVGSSSYAPTWTYTKPGNVWTHYAFVRASGTVHVFANGVEVTPSAAGQVGDINPPTSDGRTIGNYAGTGYGYGWPGYLDEVRISNMARYTANFTPQVSAFCNN